MGAISYFPDYNTDDSAAEIDGSSFGEPDGTKHRVEVLEGNGHLIIRVKIADQKPVDLLFNAEQAQLFCAGVKAVLFRIGLED